MIHSLIQLLRAGTATKRETLPTLPAFSRGIPEVTGAPCEGCNACVDACPTEAILITPEPSGGHLDLDLGRCIACGGCIAACPAGTIVENRRTTVAVRRREELVLTTRPRALQSADVAGPRPFRRSIHLRAVSTGDNASDLELAATNNPVFDASRFGIHFVASPRFADGLIVTGPVALAMHEPLRRCFDAMAEPRLVIAVGASAISGGLHRGGYAQANGLSGVLPVAAYVPGHPPHPWYILHGILLAMGHPASAPHAGILGNLAPETDDGGSYR